MSFADRNEQWRGEYREFHQLQSRSGVPRVWGIKVEGNLIHTTWGQWHGSMQTATETMQGVNVGKSNEKSPAQYALERAREMARKKNWEGYSEVRSEEQTVTGRVSGQTGVMYWVDHIKTSIDFDNLPLNLCFYKPDNTMSAGMEKKAQNGQVWYSRKRNGLAFVLARGKDHPRLYSRKMLRQHDDEVGTSLTWNDRFPHIINAASRIMPESSILLGELVVDRGGVDDFKAIQSYTKSLSLQSVMDQKTGGYPSFYIWDIAFWDGVELVKEVPVEDRYSRIHELDLSPMTYEEQIVFPFLPVEAWDVTHFQVPEQATAFAIKKGWEGFVVVDPLEPYGDKAYNFKGKPDRPGHACAKLKPTFEDDFVAFWDPEKGFGERSTKNRNNQGIKSVSLFQYNKQGQLVPISNVSSGLTDEQKRNWANTTRWPKVWKIEYKDRRYISNGEDTNALDFAAFVEERSDKTPEECINQNL